MDIKIPVEYEDTISSESESLLMQLDPKQRQRELSRSLLFYVSVGLNLVLLLVVTGLSGTLHSVQVSSCRDPGLALYCESQTCQLFANVSLRSTALSASEQCGGLHRCCPFSGCLVQ